MYIRVKKSEKYLFMYVYTRKIYLRKNGVRWTMDGVK